VTSPDTKNSLRERLTH